MAFEEGHKKFGGRQKGTENKLTSDIRKVLKHTISNELEMLPQLLENLSPVERLDYLIKILPYVLPKVNSVSPNEGEPIDWFS